MSDTFFIPVEVAASVSGYMRSRVELGVLEVLDDDESVVVTVVEFEDEITLELVEDVVEEIEFTDALELDVVDETPRLVVEDVVGKALVDDLFARSGLIFTPNNRMYVPASAATTTTPMTTKTTAPTA
jgi:hypothetical protein